MVRLIGRNDAAEVSSYWEWWSEQIANWIQEGYHPWIFTHAPDDVFAPGLARLLHELVRLHLPELKTLPDWKGFNPDITETGSELKQLELF